MRTVKFRGKRCSDGKWAYGYFVESHSSWNGHKPHKSWILDSPITNGGWFALIGRTAVEDETVSQFTGLYDKNGKEIYEGDIIEDKKYNYKHLIRYSNNKACFTATLVKFVGNDIDEGFWESDVTQSWITECEKEVIGNIHDNPELMKGGEK